ncbi:MAG TPA: DUF969 domain-containing protein [Gammaproteobacteria bacterium]
MLALIGVAIVVLGFALRLNPLLVVVAAALATGFAGGFDVVTIVSEFGRAFTQNRYMALVWFTLPVIGMLEKNGLKERAHAVMAKVQGATTGRVLTAYMLMRQLTASLGLTSFGGHAQMVRPLVAPMAEAAAENRYGELPAGTRDLIRAHSAATDNIGVFFGEDIFIAMGSVLLIKGYLEQNGYVLTPIQIALWSIPTAVAAFLIHATRLWWLDRRLKRELERRP